MLGIALYSMLSSRQPDTFYTIYILSDGITDLSKEKILSLQNAEFCSITFINIQGTIGSGVKKRFAKSQWPTTMFARIFLPHLLPHEKRVLYLDIDVLVLQDLKELFAIEVNDRILSLAVHEDQGGYIPLRKQELHLSSDHGYFNSGVMLMELDRMRQENIVNKLKDYLADERNVLYSPDQDLLNCVLCDRVQAIHPKWNWPDWHTRRQILFMAKNWGNMGKDIALEAALKPAILHLWGHPKPYQYNHRYARKLYRRFWLESPWKNEGYSGVGKCKAFLLRLRNFPFDCYISIKAKWLRFSRSN